MRIPVLLLIALASCDSETSVSYEVGGGAVVTSAVAVMDATDGHTARGVVTFTAETGGIRVHAEIDGLSPGLHGFHVHQWGNATSGDGKSAGGHFNPHGTDHAHPEAGVRHVGDLGNLEADGAGRAVYDRLDTAITFGGANSVLGRGLIIHALPDDGGQPTGNAGARVAIGVIGIAASD